ncbi:MAG TPA: PAS domain S-box protein [Vicinamibacterales bacterium]|nr:PAS domain S-box protein [Vicinamibacterales bacterium]
MPSGVAGEQTFRGLLEAAPDAIVIVNAAGRIVLVNSQAERLFGYHRDQLLGEPVELLVPESLRARHGAHRRSYHEEPRVRGMGEGLTLYGRRSDGTEVPVEISLAPLETPEGRLITASIRDVTERRRVERELAEANIELVNASRTKDRFLAAMSHELRTPLNAIIGFTGTLLMRLPGPLNADQEEQLKTVQTSARHLLALINDLLDLAKIESGKIELHPERLICQDVFRDVAASMAPSAVGKGLRFDVDAPGDPLWVRTDRRALSQILINLSANAIRFTSAGSVKLIARPVHQGAVLISVADTGVGIRDEDRARLFQAFEQLDTAAGRRQEGTGLGLHLSQGLARLLGAELSVDSVVGKGTIFSLQLPDLP